MAEGPPIREAGSSRDDSAPAAASQQTATETAEESFAEQRLGEFRILRRLGKGGMAEVFLAEQTSLKRNVAVKVLREEKLTDETHLKRFKTEAMAAAALSHPNIVQVYMIGEQTGTHYIAQEYVQGLNLREFVTRKGPPESAVAMHIIRQAASALQAAHAAGIVHRDIKPENIMITRRGDVKVADFGLAQLTQEGERVNLTQVGVTMGTPLYMSPEQVNGRKLDARSDIYSLGVTCYHMLTGAPPFRGETALSVAVQHLKQKPEPLEKVRGDLPPALCHLVHKMMAKDPARRYQNAQEIVKELKRITKGEGDGDVPAAVDVDADVDHSTRAATGSPAQRVLTGIWRIPEKSLAWQAWVFLLLALMAGAASAGVGWLTRPLNPFDEPPKPTRPVEKKDSAYSQYLYALNAKGDEAAWRAVIDNWSNEPITNYARKELALLHLSRHHLEDAQALFDQLATLPEAESQWRAFGMAGKALVLSERENYPESQRIITDLRQKSLWDKLGPRMRARIESTVRHNYEKMNKTLDPEWQSLLDEFAP
jgi:serine/threonine-protein kinase